MTEPEDQANERNQELVNLLTQKPEFMLIQNIAGHPSQLPSLAELRHVNPSRVQSLPTHLDNLVRAGLVAEHVLPADERTEDLPCTFYALTAKCREVIATSDIRFQTETLREAYEMVEKPKYIQECENAPRPTVSRKH